MVAGAHGDGLLIQQQTHVRRMTAVEHKAENPRAVFGVADATQAGNSARRVQGGGQQVLFVSRRRASINGREIIDRRRQADGAGDVGGAGLELKRQFVKGGAGKAHGLDHLATAQKGRHGLKQVFPPPQQADTRRSEQLVTGQAVKIAAQRLHVHIPVPHRLRAVHQHQGAGGVDPPRDLPHRVDCAQGVGHVVYRHQFDPLVEQTIQGVEIDTGLIGNRYGQHLGADARRDELPGHDIRVVLQPGKQHAIARFQVRRPPAVGNEIDRLRRAARPDHLAAARAVQESGQRIAGALEAPRGAIGERVRPAVHVGVVAAVVIRYGVDNGIRFLRGGGIIEVDQRLSVHRLSENGEIRAHALGVEAAAGHRLQGRHSRCLASFSSRAKRRARRGRR